ncbi:hypothetical protein BGZ83_009486 [Gryganskiella cystojenkinii]|nr:hypothetical protein BGZ83_009486 [Gryganskiella cystojenkinii]
MRTNAHGATRRLPTCFLDEHEISRAEDLSGIVPDTTADAIHTLKDQLVTRTGNLHTADFLMRIASPIVLTLDDLTKVTVLGLPGTTDQLAGRRIVEATEIHDSGMGVNEQSTIDAELSQVLLAHRYGKLILPDIEL